MVILRRRSADRPAVAAGFGRLRRENANVFSFAGLRHCMLFLGRDTTYAGWGNWNLVALCTWFLNLQLIIAMAHRKPRRRIITIAGSGPRMRRRLFYLQELLIRMIPSPDRREFAIVFAGKSPDPLLVSLSSRFVSQDSVTKHVCRWPLRCKYIIDVLA